MSREEREAQIAKLEQEIAVIRGEHAWMPPCCAKDAHALIDKKMAEIEALKSPQSADPIVSHRAAYLIGGVVAAGGLMFGSYGTFTLGVLVLIVSYLSINGRTKK